MNRPIGDDETGFRGKEDRPYRAEAWEFLLAGGALFDHLDYSFTVKHPAGTAPITTSPGGGGPAFRRQLQSLKEFLDGFDLVRMKPDNSVVKAGTITAPLEGNEAKVTVRVLADRGKAYGLYVRGGSQVDLTLDLPAGDYRAEWIHTRTGKVAKEESFHHAATNRELKSPAYTEDIALHVRRTTK